MPKQLILSKGQAVAMLDLFAHANNLGQKGLDLWVPSIDYGKSADRAKRVNVYLGADNAVAVYEDGYGVERYGDVSDFQRAYA